MSNKSRLGRGLGGLISDASPVKKTTASAPAKKSAAKRAVVAKVAPDAPIHSMQGLQELAVKDIVANPYQPRREMNLQHVEELAKSIQVEGLIQPVVVRSQGSKYELIAGERRLRAFESLRRKTIPARIIEASDASSAALALIENLQREDLNPIDEALGYASLMRDFDLTQEAASKRVGKSRAAIANSLRLLTLSSEIQGFLSRRLISIGHAKVLLSLEDEAYRKLLARRIIETGMSVREVESEVKRLKSSGSTNKIGRKVSKAEVTVISDLEKRLGEHLNSRVTLKHSRRKGRITIEYYGNDDLDRILEKLGISNS